MKKSKNFIPYSNYLIYEPSQREVNFILYRLKIENGDVTFPRDLDYLNSYLINRAKTFSSPIQSQYLNPKIFLVSDESIAWLDDIRASIWFYSYMKLEQNDIFKEISEYGDFQKDLIMAFDFFGLDTKLIDLHDWRNTFDSKKYSLNFSKILYNELKTKPKHIDWLDLRNIEQLKWAVDYMDEKDRLIKPSTFIPITNKQYYDQICASIDTLDLFEIASGFQTIELDINSSTNDQYIAGVDNSVISRIQESGGTSESGLKGSSQTDLHCEYIRNMNGELVSNPNSSKATANHQKDSPSHTKDIYKDSELSDYLKDKVDPYRSYFKMTEYKKNFLKNMRNSWNQKTYRDKPNNRSPTKLPYGCNKLLEGIAKAYGENDLDKCLKQILQLELSKLKN